MTNKQKWLDLFEWINQQPDYLKDFTYGLNDLFYGGDEDHFRLEDHYAGRIVVYLPATGGAPVDISISSGCLKFEFDQIGFMYIDGDRDFKDYAHQIVKSMETLDTDTLTKKIKQRLQDEMTHRSEEAKARKAKSIDEEKRRLEKKLAELEAARPTLPTAETETT